MVDEADQAAHEYSAACEEAERSAVESATMEAWVLEQRKAGRPEAELTWGNCVRERGILQ